MDVHSSVSENSDKTKNYSLGVGQSGNNSSVSANAFVHGYNDKPGRNSDYYSAVGGNLSAEKSGHSVSLGAQHIPKFGNQATVAASINLLDKNDHKVNAHAFTTLNAPKAGPNYSTHGGGIDYKYKEQLGVGASMANTPMFKHEQYSVAGNMNLHRTPTSSLDLNIGASKVNTSFSKGNWQPGASFTFRKQF